MVYLRDCTRKCSLCDSKATKELVNDRNATMGYYCSRHGGGALRRVQKAEEERAVREREAFDARSGEIRRDILGMD